MADSKKKYPKSGLWKDYFDRHRVGNMTDEIKAVCPTFNKKRFMRKVFSSSWDSFELKERLRHTAESLHDTLPRDYDKAVDILVQVAPKLGEFENWALLTYVELFGLEHFERSIETLARLTRYGTAEFAVRPFMIRYTTRMMNILDKWADDPSEHLRRLAAECSRPRGVWVEHIRAFREDPAPVLRLLEKLKADKSLYVRKAVANSLNDISRDNPDKVIRLCKRWYAGGSADTRWIVKRACRTLVKRGNRKALAILGFTTRPKITASPIRLHPNKPLIGSALRFSCTLVAANDARQKLVLDYAIHFRKGNGKTSRALFKLAEPEIEPKRKYQLKGRYMFKKLSTRNYHPGRHKIELLINGQPCAEATFELIEMPQQMCA